MSTAIQKNKQAPHSPSISRGHILILHQGDELPDNIQSMVDHLQLSCQGWTFDQIDNDVTKQIHLDAALIIVDNENHLKNNIIRNCTASYNGLGMYAHSADNNDFIENVCFNNIHQTVTPYTDGHGLGAYNSSNCQFINNVAYGNYTNLCICGGQNHRVIENKLYDPQTGTNCLGYGNVSGGENNISKNKWDPYGWKPGLKYLRERWLKKHIKLLSK